MVGYKYDTLEKDPLVGIKDEKYMSGMWSDPLTGRPALETPSPFLLAQIGGNRHPQTIKTHECPKGASFHILHPLLSLENFVAFLQSNRCT